MCATGRLSDNPSAPSVVRKGDATRRRIRYERRLTVLHNRHDWATLARDRALDRLDAVHAAMVALDAEYADVAGTFPCCPRGES